MVPWIITAAIQGRPITYVKPRAISFSMEFSAGPGAGRGSRMPSNVSVLTRKVVTSSHNAIGADVATTTSPPSAPPAIPATLLVSSLIAFALGMASRGTSDGSSAALAGR
jgi:hypothetical protein